MTQGEVINILVVDDSKLMRRAITKILGSKYDIIEAADGEEGWNQLSSDPTIRVTISDLNMPKLDGYGLLGIIRGYEDEERIRNMPVIVITAKELTIAERAILMSQESRTL